MKQLAPENYWTEKKVHYWLTVYPRLAASCRFDCLVDAPDISVANTAAQLGPRRLNARWTHYASIKADLDVAIKHLPVHLRTVALLYYCAGYLDVRTVGRSLGISHDTVWKRLRQAKERVILHLCEK